MPSLGGHRWFLPAIDAIVKNTQASYELILVYNGPRGGLDGFSQDVKTWAPGARVIASDERYCISRAYNLGMAAARGEYLALFHDDVLVLEGGWLRKVVEKLEAHPEIGVLGPYGKFLHRQPVDCRTWPNGIREADWLPAWPCVTKRDGCPRMDEFYKAGMEDTDWCYSFREQGRFVAAWGFKIWHVGGMAWKVAMRDPAFKRRWHQREPTRVTHFLLKFRDILGKQYFEKAVNHYGLELQYGPDMDDDTSPDDQCAAS